MLTLDTNVLVYTADFRVAAKQKTASHVVDRAIALGAPLALQCVGEFQNVLRRRLHVPTAEAVRAARAISNRFETFPYDAACVRRALDEAEVGRYSYWDALLLSAASAAGCTVLLSEDMRDGAYFDGLAIINPFASDGLLNEAAERALSSFVKENP